MITAVRNLRNGDQGALREIFEAYFASLCAFGFKYVSDTALAEDIAQEVFVSLWENRNNFEHPNSLKAFLFTSVRNKCLNHLKHNMVKRKHEEHLIRELEYDQFYESQVIEEEVFARLMSEINNLPASAQKIMILALNGLKNPQIADELGISLNTVKTQKKIAYNRLKKSVGELIQPILLTLL